MPRYSFLIVPVAFLALTLQAVPASRAAFPDDPPNDPDYDRWEMGEGGYSFYDEQWTLFSFTPRDVRLTNEASGISADLAWRTTTGRKDVIIAILDSGIDWGERDLVNQFHLNKSELSEPQDADERWTPGLFDVNGDGVFNIQDYSGDPRVFDADGNGVFDPGDLIAIFSDGVDDDVNGYIDDISGWDFFEDDNDPFDNVDFNHGTGRSEEAAAEGDNGLEGIGVAPNATLLAVRIGDSFIVDVNDFAQGVIYAADAGARAALDITVPGLKLPFEHHLSAWDARTGEYLPFFPRVVEDFQFFVIPAIADLDGDGFPEIIAGSGGYLIHAFNHLGREPSGWRKFTGHWLSASAAVGNIDGDSLLEVAIGTREGQLFVLDTGGSTHVGGRLSVQWQKSHRDQ